MLGCPPKSCADSSVPPSSPLPHRMQLVTAGRLLALLYNPPTNFSASLAVMVQLVSSGLEARLNIAPPLPAEFPLSRQLTSAAWLRSRLNIPPPSSP